MMVRCYCIKFTAMKKCIVCAALCCMLCTARTQNYIHDPFTQVKNNAEFALYPFAGGLNNPQFWPIDLDLNGVEDMLIFDRTGGKCLTFINNGTPGQVDYVYAPIYESIFPPMQNFVVLQDVNCDNIPDLFTSFDNGIKVYYSELSGSSFSYSEEIEKLNYTSAGFNFEVFVGVIDIPAVVDVNMDGDVDLLNFRPAGGFVDYFENQQVEDGEACGVLQLKLITSCWGNFYESGINKAVELDTVCSGEPDGRSGLHAGSTFLAYDVDLDDDIDILLGDLSFNNLNALYNGGDATSAYITSQDTAFPVYNLPVDLPTFPAPFLMDVNNDNKKDLLVAPNKKGFSQNTHNVWWYKNNAVDDGFLFTYQMDSFMVSDMIDVGEGSHAVFFDYNQDGLQDIIIGNYGYFSDGDFSSALALYKNTGSSTVPEFQLITRDYAEISVFNFINIYPAFYDMDNDGATDMIIGEETGALHYFRNTAPAGSEPVFVLQEAFYKDIDVGIASAPNILDLTGDGLPDLIIGEQNGNLNYYENIGTAGDPEFNLVSEFWGNVDVRTPGLLTGHSTPYLFRDDAGNWQLFVGCEAGTIFHYQPTSDWTGAFTLITSSFSGLDEGEFSNVAFLDITDDNIPELLAGNYRGGISLYGDESTIDNVTELDKNTILVFPNPVTGILFINSDNMLLNDLKIFSIDGKLVYNTNVFTTSAQLDITALAPGIYILYVQLQDGSIAVKKIMKS